MPLRSVLFLLLISISSPAQENNAQFQKDSAALISITQALMDAVAPGDTAVWSKYLHDDFIYTIEDGSVKRKAAVIQDLRPLPPGYVGSIKVIQPHMVSSGNTYILNYIADENLSLYGQHIHTKYIETQTFIKVNDQFKLLAAEVFELFADPVPAIVKSATLQKYTGTYRLGPGVEYKVTLHNNQLTGQRTGRAAALLVPETESVFFIKEQRGRKIFVSDSTGKTLQLVDRRNGNDLIWKKIE